MRWVAIAAAAQREQLLLQRAQRCQSLSHASDVLVEERIDLGTGLLGLRSERQQLAHVGQRNVERSAMANELQPLDVALGIPAVAGGLALGFFEQTLAFVEPNGLHIASALGGQLTDLHHKPLRLTLYPL